MPENIGLNLNGGNTLSGVGSNNTFGPLGGNISTTITNTPQYVPKAIAPTKKEIKQRQRTEKEKQRYPKQASVAAGFGRITSMINHAIHDIRQKVNDIYYGKKPINPQSKSINPLNYGLINVLNLLLEVDVCAIFSYGLNKLPGTKPFDPNDKKNASKSVFGAIKWEAQNQAYQINTTIDSYYTSYGDVNSPSTKIGLFSLIQNLNNQVSSVQNLLNSESLISTYPELNTVNNFFDNAQKYYAKYTDINSINDRNVAEIIDFINKTKTSCSVVLALNNPSAALKLIDSLFGSDLMNQIKKLDKVIDPKNLPKAIKNITDASQKVQNVCNKILEYIQYARLIITIATVLIVVLKLINKFLKFLGVPNIFTFLGLSTTMSEANTKVVDTIDYFMNRLQEVNSVLNSVYNLCKDLNNKIQNLINGSRELVQNLLDCQDSEAPPLSDSINDLNDSINVLQSIQNQLNEFINTYDNNQKKKNNTFGNYTIEILTEELTDENIPRKRRYGVALDATSAVIVKSTPTFASDDRIIIEEVKLLLISKKLVDSAAASATSLRELSIMEESLSYLQNADVSLEDLDAAVSSDPVSDDPENDDEDDEENDSLNINAFISKLKGGRKLRRRMRIKMAQQKMDLVKSLEKSDKSGKYSSTIIKKKKTEAITDSIKAEEELIKVYKEAIKKYTIILVAGGNPAIIIQIRKKEKQIKEVEKKIQHLKKQLLQIK